LPDYLKVARSSKLGLELQEFANPNLLDNDWRATLREYQSHLDGFDQPITLHGAFIDLISGSPDRRVAAIARDRYRQNLEVAHELDARVIDFHANYLPLVDHPSYLPDWENRQVEFWAPMAEEAARVGVTLVLENMWEPDPSIIYHILSRIQSPYLKACLDVGHASLYSRLPVGAWIKQLGDQLIYTHLHNNHGTTDEHLAFGDGVLDFPELLATLRALPNPPMFILELPNLASIQDSLSYLELD
jgi:sugar phosphate isomerase/epimerase